jgi:hypothetical protein
MFRCFKLACRGSLTITWKEQYMKLQTILHSRFWALLLSSLALTTLLSACAFDSGNSAGSSASQSGYVFTNPSNPTPPPFPAVTIGAWMSNMTPSLGDTVTLYVILRKQPADMKTAPAPIPGVSVSTDTGLHGTTGSDGIAAISFQAGGKPAQPNRVDVSASVSGTTVTTNTFYTCLPTALLGAPTATPTH